MMNLEKKDGRGTYQFAVDSKNKVLCCQWVDSQVVNVVSSMLSTEMAKVKRRVDSRKEEFPCPWIITRYQKNMQGVNKSEQLTSAFGGFSAKAHYQKWYKRAYFAILDMMALNALVAWNMAAKTGRSTRVELNRREFLLCIAQSMLDYQDNKSLGDPNGTETPAIKANPDTEMDRHLPVPNKFRNSKCLVCRLDHNIKRQSLDSIKDELIKKETLRNSLQNIEAQLAFCTKCRITAHPTIPKKQRHIHSIDDFKGLTCFQIAHTQKGFEVWKRNTDNTSGRAYNPQMTHPICQQVRGLHGLQAKQARKRKRNSADDEAEE